MGSATAKNELVLELIREHGVDAYEGSVSDIVVKDLSELLEQ